MYQTKRKIVLTASHSSFLGVTAVLIVIPSVILAADKRQANYVHSGLVPIFGDVTHNPPLTFTFTTPTPRSVTKPSYLVNIEPPKEINPIGSLPSSMSSLNSIQYNMPPSQQIIMNPKPFSTGFEQPKTAMSQPQSYMSILTTPTTMNPPPSDQEKWDDEYNRLWAKMSQSWNELKQNLAKSGLDRDWKNIFAKLTNTVEPYVYSLSEQLGEVLNAAVRQQQSGVLQKGSVLNKVQTSLGRMVQGEQQAPVTVAQILDTLFRSGPPEEPKPSQ